VIGRPLYGFKAKMRNRMHKCKSYPNWNAVDL
jgi:hypothetical protein